MGACGQIRDFLTLSLSHYHCSIIPEECQYFSESNGYGDQYYSPNAIDTGRSGAAVCLIPRGRDRASVKQLLEHNCPQLRSRGEGVRRRRHQRRKGGTFK